MSEHTEQPDAPPAVHGEATEPPGLFLFLLWVPVFAVVTWGVMLLFGRRPWEFHPSDRRDPPPRP